LLHIQEMLGILPEELANLIEVSGVLHSATKKMIG
jgi:hypothetical protein